MQLWSELFFYFSLYQECCKQIISLNYLQCFRGLGGFGGGGEEGRHLFCSLVGWWVWFLGNNTWQQLLLEDLKVNSTKSHVSFLQGRVTHIHELIYDNEILLEENISVLKTN